MNHLNFKRVLFALLLPGIISIPQVLAEEKKQKRPKRLAPVVTTVANEQMLSPTIKVPGTIVSRQEAELPAEVDARITWVADVGTQIKRGDAVAKLDATLYQLRAAENKAALKQKQTQLKYLEKELDRLEELEKSDFSSKTELDKIRLDRDLARSELVVAKAKIKIDEETLARYKVRAPFNGVVIDRVKRRGEWVDGGETVVKLSNPNKLEIEARINEESIRFLKTGSKVNIFRKKQKATGIVRAIVSVGDEQSHLFDIRIDLDKTQWLAGQTVKVEVPTGESEKVLAVPRDALVLRSSGASVFKISKDNKAQKVSVVTGIASESLIQVKGDLLPGDTIVVRGSERLRPGQEVKIIPSDS